MLVSEGLSNKEIGRRLNISEGTVKIHLNKIYGKTGISNRTMLAGTVQRCTSRPHIGCMLFSGLSARDCNGTNDCFFKKRFQSKYPKGLV
jgi:hypothetical protein